MDSWDMYLHTNLLTCIHTYIHAHTHTLNVIVHTCMHTYIHAYTSKFPPDPRCGSEDMQCGFLELSLNG